MGMHLPLFVDKESKTPVYRQITRQITQLVKDGELTPGDKLPPERVIAQQLDVARGTIKKAYLELAQNNIIEVTQGRGSFVSALNLAASNSRKDQAITLLQETFHKLKELNFSAKEIQLFTQLILLESEHRKAEFAIAAVDCNPEALNIFRHQLQYISKITLYDYLLDDLVTHENPTSLLKNYNLILTTTTHYSELCGLVPTLAEKVIQAAVAPSHQTIIDVASIKDDSSVGIICESKTFDRIIRNRLRSLGISTKNIKTLWYTKLHHIDQFLSDRSILILPPDGKNRLSNFANEVQTFTTGGGLIIPFEYQIERGSLIYIEEQISKRLDREN